MGVALIIGGAMGCSERTRRARTAPDADWAVAVDVPPERRTPPPPPRGERAEAPEGYQRYVLAYPTGERESAALLVEKIAPEAVRAGEPYTYRIRVTNLTDAPLTNVVIDEQAPGIEIAEAGIAEGRGPQARIRPIAMEEPGQWAIGTLPPGATRVIQVTAIAGEEGERRSCLAVDYEPTLCTSVAVVNPELQLTKAAPRAAYVCDQPAFRYEVANTGTGTAQDVVILEELPEGLVTADGESTIRIEVGDLPAGASEQFTVPLQPQATGTFQSRAIARSATDEVASTATSTRIVQPQLAVEVTGPEWQYAGEPTTYTVRVTNVSDVPARDAQLMFAAPGTEAELEPRDLGALPPGETRTANVTLEAEGEQIALRAAARSACAPVVADQVTTDVRRIAALLVETIDSEDPVRVGETITYEITVKNQGRAAAEDVEISAVIPEGLRVLSVEGPTEPRISGNRLLLGPIEALPAGQTATWYVEARAERPGTYRFRTEVDSAFLDRPVPDVEPTRVITPQ